MSMKIEKIPAYHIDTIDGTMQEITVFSESGRNLLLGKNGNMFLCSDEILDEIKNNVIEDKLFVPLVQHGLLSIGDMNQNSDKDLEVHPVFFMIDMTNRCNMACKYCLREREDSDKAYSISSEMLIKICDYIISYCRQTGEERITIQPWGGEPLLETEKIYKLQDYFEEHGLYPAISIETNGILLNESVLEKMHRRNIWISVSIDGPEKVHDAQRVFTNGKNTHALVEKNLLNLKEKNNGNVSVLITVTKKTYLNIREIIRYFALDLGLHSIKINFVHKSNFVDNDNLCLDKEEISKCTEMVFDTILELNEEGVEIGDYNIYTKMSNLLFHTLSDVCISNGCHGGRRMIAFDQNGGIFPCDVTDYKEECLGNINDNDSLVEVINQAISTHAYFAEKHEQKCDSCPWHVYCRGGCTVHLKTQGLNPPATDDIECAVNSVLYPKMIELILNDPMKVNRLIGREVL